MAQLNIKDELVASKLRSLADRRQTTVIDLLRQMVEREEANDEAERARRVEAIRTITRESAKLFPVGAVSGHDYLYDENGLPK